MQSNPAFSPNRPQSGNARRVSIRNATVTGENPIGRSPPPKPMRSVPRHQPSPGGTIEEGPQKGEGMEMSEKRETKPHLKEQSLRGSIYATVATDASQVEDPPKKASDVVKGKYSGKQPLQFALWGYYMTYGAALFNIIFGAFAIAFVNPSFFECRVDGDDIFDGYILSEQNGNCSATFSQDDQTKYACCDPDDESILVGSVPIGGLYIVYGIFMFILNNPEWGFGLWYPTDLFTYQMRISPLGILHILVGIVGLSTYVSCIAGFTLISTGVVLCIACKRKEAGDGGREYRAAQRSKKKASSDDGDEGFFQACIETCSPIQFFRRIYNEDKIASYAWLFVYLAVNVILFFYTLSSWLDTVNTMKEDLKDGNLRIDCDGPVCQFNRRVIKYGPLSDFAPFAKACGNLLNFNCALILLPVTKMLLTKINNFGVGASSSTSLFTRIFAHPITRYIPLSKNIEFHKIIAGFVFFYAAGHTLFHFLNLMYAAETTLYRFQGWGWEGTDLFTGAIVVIAMFFIYTSAPDRVKHAKFEIFFFNHQWLIVFFLALLIHGPVFYYWAIMPFVLYLYERYLRINRGGKPMLLVQVEWIEPVLAIYFKPAFKDDFKFTEGQYLLMNCPHIAKNEWHPFTISSASGDMENSARIHLETGEEVVPVPRPKNLAASAKWNKFCLASEDWRSMSPDNYLEKHETGYNDFVSIHVKVHGLDDLVARSWTRKFKEYVELLNPVSDFPFYFNSRDQRGDVQIGKLNGPDGLQLIRIDGPHSAPAEHYVNYNTVMLIGAGIGLTPCASILTALTKYRWKKNFTPELVHFYWVVRQSDIPSYQWLVHMLTDLEYVLKKSRDSGQITNRYYCEINIYVTGVAKTPVEVEALKRPSSLSLGFSPPNFTAEELYSAMMNPTVSSKSQIEKMRDKRAENRFQDIWVWNGRPDWDGVFAEMKAQRQHADIGVCFCGTPVIGADLKSMCEKYSNKDEDCLFSLHKENF